MAALRGWGRFLFLSLTRAKEEHWDGSTITNGNCARDELWTLEQTGTWELNQVDLDGDLNDNEANELNDDRTHNAVNKPTARDTDDNGAANDTLTYNARGDMTHDGKSSTLDRLKGWE